MKRNGQYVGVDEKYIPEDEKYVEESIYSDSEIREGINKAKPYAKKGLKIAKNVGIAYLIFVGVIFLFVIAMFIFVISNFFRINDKMDDQFNKINSQYNTINETINNRQ